MKTISVFSISFILFIGCCMPIKMNGQNLLKQSTIHHEKNDTIHVVGHAHMDMNWLWTYFEWPMTICAKLWLLWMNFLILPWYRARLLCTNL